MHKIQTKLMMGLVGMTLVIVAFLWIYQVAFLESNYINAQKEKLVSIVETAAMSYSNQSLDAFEKLTEEMYYKDNLTIEVLNLEGNSLFVTGNMMGRGHMMGQRGLSMEMLREISIEGDLLTTAKNTRLNLETLLYALRIEDSEAILIGTLPLEPIKATVDILESQLFYLTLILLLLSILMSIFIAKYFIKPIKELNYSVKAIAEGKLDTRVALSSKDEFGDLAKSFNHMAENLTRVEHLRKDLIANVSHELKTPLGIIKGYAEMTRDLHGDNATKRNDNLNLIVEESDRLTEMVNGLLDLSQLQAGYTKLNLEKIAFGELSHNVLEKYKTLANEHQLSLIDKVSNEVTVYIDKARIEQVLHNFLSNAIRYTEPGGEIILATSQNQEGELEVSISDTGIGIPEASMASIWSRYYKVNAQSQSGMGLGLAIAGNILEAHGFKYGVESTEGKGSKFYFCIPKDKII